MGAASMEINERENPGNLSFHLKCRSIQFSGSTRNVSLSSIAFLRTNLVSASGFGLVIATRPDQCDMHIQGFYTELLQQSPVPAQRNQ